MKDLKLHLKISYYDTVEINISSLSVEDKSVNNNKYYIHTDKKWMKFCKEHRFHPKNDARGKIYNLYLQLCAEGLI